MTPYTMESEVYSLAHNISHIVSGEYLIHAHPFYELYYCVGGDVNFLVSGVEHKVKPDTMIIIQPNEFHGIRVNSSQTYDRFTMHFDLDLLSVEHRSLLVSALPGARGPAEGDAGGVAAGSPANYLEDAHKLGMRSAFENFDALAELDEDMQRKLIPIFMEALLARLLAVRPKPQLQEEGAHGRSSNTAKQVVEYINEHFTEKLTLDILAEKFYISKSHLNLSFRKATGTTVIDYLIHKRVTYAQQLLINGLFAAQAATVAGFSDYTSFYRAYVKHFGHSPSSDFNKESVGHDLIRQNLHDLRILNGTPRELRDSSSLWSRLPATTVSEDPGILKDE